MRSYEHIIITETQRFLFPPDDREKNTHLTEKKKKNGLLPRSQTLPSDDENRVEFGE